MEAWKPVLTAAFVFQTVTAWAQPVTWQEAVRLAREGNHALAASRHAWKSAQAAVGGPLSQFFPSLNANGSLTRNGTQAFSTLEPPLRLLDFSQTAGQEHDVTTYDFGLSAGWNLFNGFASWASLDSAVQAAVQRRAAYDQASQNLRYNLRANFNQLLFAQENILLLGQTRERLERHAKYMQMRFESGQEARWAALQSQADLESIQWQIGQNQVNRKAQIASFGALLGQSIEDADFEVAGSLIDPPGPPAFGDARSRLLGGHPAIRLQQAALEQARAQLSQAQGSLWPSLNAGSSFYYNGGNATFYTGNSRWPPDQTVWTLGLTANYDLFSGGARSALVRQDAENLASTQDSLKDLQLSLQAQLYQAWAGYQAAFDRLPVTRMQLEAATQQLSTTENLYQAGRKAFWEFEQAQSNLTGQSQNELASRLDVMQNAASFERALGLILEEDK
jgi:outer membrane protein TolC